jgi:NTE family protein
VTTVSFDDGFTLALGGGGARGWAHIGVARALASRGMTPTRIVGTSMGAIIGAGMAAGRTADEMEAEALRTPVMALMGRPGRLSFYDSRPLLVRLAADLGDPRIEDLPTPLGITTYDLVTGRSRLITRGRLVDALEISIAVPFFLPPRRSREGVWCDAGPWEGIPVTHSRAWAPDLPIIGVLADIPKPGFLSSRLGAAFLRTASAGLGIGSPTDPLTARRYLALVTARWAEPVVDEPPDLMIRPRLGRMSALQFSRVQPAVEIGERDAGEILDAVVAARSEASAHAA